MKSHSVPAEAITIYNKALEKTNRGDFSNAISEYQRAIKMYPYFIEAYNNMGEIYSIIGERDLAITAYSKALEIKKNDKVLLNLGVEYYNSGQYDKALSYFNESLKQNINFHEANYYIGLTYYNLKDYVKSEKFLKKVVQKDHSHLKANYMLSYIYYEWKQYNLVLECLEAIKNIADDKAFINKYYGFCCYYLGRYEEAVPYLTNALKQQPEYEKFKKYLEGLTYENKVKEIGDVDKAIKELEKILMNKSPKLTEITKLSMLYVFKGDNKKAEDLVQSYKNKFLAKAI